MLNLSEKTDNYHIFFFDRIKNISYYIKTNKMADKFLNTGGSGNSNISNGTATIFGATIGAADLISSKPLKTNSTKQLISTNLDIADINSLQTELEVKPNLTFIKSDTQTNPATNGIKLYAKLDGNLYKRDSTGAETGFGGGGGTFQQIYDGSTPALITTATTKPLVLQTGSADTDVLIACSNLLGNKNFSVKADGDMDIKKIKSTTGNVEIELADTIIKMNCGNGTIENIGKTQVQNSINDNSIRFDSETNSIEFYDGAAKKAGIQQSTTGAGNDLILTTDTLSVKTDAVAEDFFRVWNEGTYTSFEMKDGTGTTVSRFSTNGGVGNPNTFNIESFSNSASDGKITMTGFSDVGIISNTSTISLTPFTSTIFKNPQNNNNISVNTVSNIIEIKDDVTSLAYIQSTGSGTALESANALFLTGVNDMTLSQNRFHLLFKRCAAVYQ